MPHVVRREVVVGITRFLSVIGLLMSLILIAETPLQAYLDPGSGLMVWQAVIAGVLSAAYFMRKLMRRMMFWKRPGGSLGHNNDRQP